VRDFYRVLEVDPNADFDTIRESYRRLLKRYHPDSGGRAADPAKLDRVVEAFRRISSLRGAERRPRKQHTARRHATGTRPSARRRDTRTNRDTGPDVFSLGGMLTGSPDARTRAFAARRLADSGRRSAYPYLRRGLSDENRQVVLACLEAIGRLKVAQSAGDLSAVFHSSDVRTRRAVIRTVAEIDRLELFRNLILAGLEDEDPAVRRDAVRLFVKLDR
jgi:curved DNA-binding protein CbpA